MWTTVNVGPRVNKPIKTPNSMDVADEMYAAHSVAKDNTNRRIGGKNFLNGGSFTGRFVDWLEVVLLL